MLCRCRGPKPPAKRKPRSVNSGAWVLRPPWVRGVPVLSHRDLRGSDQAAVAEQLYGVGTSGKACAVIVDTHFEILVLVVHFAHGRITQAFALEIESRHGLGRQHIAVGRGDTDVDGLFARCRQLVGRQYEIHAQARGILDPRYGLWFLFRTGFERGDI